MDNRTSSIVLVSALVGIGAFALLRTEHTSATARQEEPPAPPPVAQAPQSPGAPIAPPIDPNTTELPPGHPDIGGGQGMAAPPGMQAAPGAQVPSLPPPSSTGPGALTWKAPASWTAAPNPSTMRLATYHPPRAPGDGEDAEVAITRAGGETDANIQRWLGQFSEHSPEIRTVSMVRGMKITVVDVSGTFGAGGMMMPGAAPSAHPGWTLLAAIVETADSGGSPYFVKITGPTATVHAARPGLDSLLQSLAPAA
jgi:hypothetical protein